MIFTLQQQEKITKDFLIFKETGQNGFSFSESSFPSLKIFFGTEPKFTLVNVMEIDGVQVYLGKDSEESVDLLKEYGNE